MSIIFQPAGLSELSLSIFEIVIFFIFAFVSDYEEHFQVFFSELLLIQNLFNYSYFAGLVSPLSSPKLV